MKRFIIVEIIVIAALAIGFFVGRASKAGDSLVAYYTSADAAWEKAQQADTPPVTLEDEDQKRVSEVRALYRHVFERYPDNRWADDAVYQLSSRLGRTDEEAFALFRRLINNYPDSEWVDDSLYTIAIAYYRLAEDIKKTDSVESADAYYDRASAMFDQLIQDYPGSALSDESHFNRAMCLYGKEMWTDALEALDGLREAFMGSDLLYSIVYYTGMIFTERQAYDEARVEFQNVVSSGHEELAPLAQFGISQTYFAEAKYDEAIESYQKVIDTYPDTNMAQESHFNIGWAYEKLKKYDEAIIQVEGAIEKYPHNENTANMQFYVGQIYYAKEDTDGAINAYRKVADNPTYNYDTRRQAQYWVGYIYEKADRTEEAIGEYQQLLKDFPEPHRTLRHPSNNINENYIQKLRTGEL